METKEIVFVHGVIYKCTNLVNGKIYIGKTVNLKRRIEKHVKSVDNTHFHRAIQKYGKENFKWEVVDSAPTKEELSTKEYLHIFIFNSINNKIVYNMTKGGAGGFSYLQQTDSEKREMYKLQNENREKTLIKKYGYKSYNQYRKEFGMPLEASLTKGKTYDERYGPERADEIKKSISKKLKGANIDYSKRDYSNYKGNGGHKHTLESKRKMSLARKDKSYSEFYGEERVESIKTKQAQSKHKYLIIKFNNELPLREEVLLIISKNKYITYEDIVQKINVEKYFIRQSLRLVGIENFQKFKMDFSEKYAVPWDIFFNEKIETLRSLAR